MKREEDGLEFRPNNVKRQRDAAAFARIAQARAEGFPIEAIMICESIITHRLVSHFARIHQSGGTIPNRELAKMLDAPAHGEDGNHVSTGSLVRAMDAGFDDLGEERFEGLPGRLLYWVEDRDRAVHVFVEKHPFAKPYGEPFEDLLERVDACAETGAQLARTLDAWTRRMAAEQV